MSAQVARNEKTSQNTLFFLFQRDSLGKNVFNVGLSMILSNYVWIDIERNKKSGWFPDKLFWACDAVFAPTEKSLGRSC